MPSFAEEFALLAAFGMDVQGGEHAARPTDNAWMPHGPSVPPVQDLRRDREGQRLPVSGFSEEPQPVQAERPDPELQPCVVQVGLRAQGDRYAMPARPPFGIREQQKIGGAVRTAQRHSGGPDRIEVLLPPLALEDFLFGVDDQTEHRAERTADEAGVPDDSPVFTMEDLGGSTTSGGGGS